MSSPLVLPLFPLNSVLFPQGRMNLRIFEARYMDMIAQCMKSDSSFGVCLIERGEEVGSAAVPHLAGTEARIVDWDMREPGMLQITIRGGRRFRVLEHSVDKQARVLGMVSWIDEPATQPVSTQHQALLPLLQAVITDAGEEVIPRPHALDDAAWVGYRYAEILPIPNLARQRLLELEDTDLRLAIVHEYLLEHHLLKED
jgi:uncharacterized protein